MKYYLQVLGIYKGRKVSTKKSVLTTHNSPLSSIIIYWRKLNSILTKTLYPLTEKACIYSEGNRYITLILIFLMNYDFYDTMAPIVKEIRKWKPLAVR